MCIASPTATSKETVDNDKKVFKSHYHKFCDTLTDIENLLKYFITENIINSDDQSEILATPRPSQKVVLLLKHISGPLEAGSTKPFRMMLDIMEKHGILGTKHLAISVRKCLTTTSQGVCVYVCGCVYACKLKFRQYYFQTLGQAVVEVCF